MYRVTEAKLVALLSRCMVTPCLSLVAIIVSLEEPGDKDSYAWSLIGVLVTKRLGARATTEKPQIDIISTLAQTFDIGWRSHTNRFR